MPSQIKTKNISLCAILVALAMVFSYIELLIPFQFGIPGMKLGLPNLVVLMALYALGGGYAFLINLVRIMLTALMFGGMAGMLYSLSGGLLSFAVMYLLKKTGMFSMAGVSMAGGVAHNVGQLLVATFVVENLKVMFLLPVLMFSGMITGILMGILGYYVMARTPFSSLL